ncbi:hypothetical protein EHQ53_16825 [Leptospira langatensis]|uniref:Knr4/Smi1-like domain-containing protein n=1 Tax=Leptospira langatensis TaxID=2484983 RepID=A0A5F1ZP51_9LEPT|nr:SMI1/KNR4 family protein [Leptospira langatensis]TGK05305.1 hypothetical protein EHO57_01065 [Leptospira langatensis]TGL38441.1 hypothetical protein EHQ53_16825 [Leptospira langatensis]
MLQQLIEKLYELTWKKTGNKNELLNPGSQTNSKKFPSQLQKLYSIADGQKEEFPSLFLHYSFMPLADAIQEKEMLDELAIEEKWDEMAEKEGLEDPWWDKDWYPFGDLQRTGDLLVLDKKTGKILEFIHDSPEREEQAESLEAYLEDLIQGLESGELYFDPKLGIVDRGAESFRKFAIDESIEARKKNRWRIDWANINWKQFWLDIAVGDRPEGFGYFGRIIQAFVFAFYVFLIFLFKWIYSHFSG